MQAVRADILPPAPEGLEGSELKVKYISTLAMAQKAVATQNIDRIAQFTGGLMQLGFESAGKKFNPQQAVDEYAKAIGSPLLLFQMMLLRNKKLLKLSSKR